MCKCLQEGERCILISQGRWLSTLVLAGLNTTQRLEAAETGIL